MILEDIFYLNSIEDGDFRLMQQDRRFRIVFKINEKPLHQSTN